MAEDRSFEPGDGSGDDAEDESAEVGDTGDPGAADTTAVAAWWDLLAFSAFQREVFKIDLSVVSAARDLARSAVAPHLEALVEAQRSVLDGVRSSIDMTKIQPVVDKLALGPFDDESRRRLFEELAAATAQAADISSLVSSQDAAREIVELLSVQSNQITESIRALAEVALPKLDLELPKLLTDDLREQMLAPISPNLRGRPASLEDVARIGLDEGLSLAWVPRTELVSGRPGGASRAARRSRR